MVWHSRDSKSRLAIRICRSANQAARNENPNSCIQLSRRLSPEKGKSCLSCGNDYLCPEISSRMGTTSLNLPGGSRPATRALTRVTSGRMVMKSERQSERDGTQGQAHQSRESPIVSVGAPRGGYEALTKFL